MSMAYNDRFSLKNVHHTLPKCISLHPIRSFSYLNCQNLNPPVSASSLERIFVAVVLPLSVLRRWQNECSQLYVAFIRIFFCHKFPDFT